MSFYRYAIHALFPSFAALHYANSTQFESAYQIKRQNSLGNLHFSTPGTRFYLNLNQRQKRRDWRRNPHARPKRNRK